MVGGRLFRSAVWGYGIGLASSVIVGRSIITNDYSTGTDNYVRMGIYLGGSLLGATMGYVIGYLSGRRRRV